MIEESVRVVKVDADKVWVQAIQVSACGSCQAQKGCGHSLLAKAGQKEITITVARNEVPVRVDDVVIIGVPDQVVLRSSLFMYGTPLMAMITVSLILTFLQFSENATIVGAFLALVLGFVWVANQAKGFDISKWHPILLRQSVQGVQLIPACELET